MGRGKEIGTLKSDAIEDDRLVGVALSGEHAGRFEDDRKVWIRVRDGEGVEERLAGKPGGARAKVWAVGEADGGVCGGLGAVPDVVGVCLWGEGRAGV